VQTAQDEEGKESVVVEESFSSFKRGTGAQKTILVFLSRIQCCKFAKDEKTKTTIHKVLLQRAC